MTALKPGDDVTVTLSGGGTRLYAHLGVLAALELRGLRVVEVSGVSGGAIVAAAYACLGLHGATQAIRSFDVAGLLRPGLSAALHYGAFDNTATRDACRSLGLDWGMAAASGVRLRLGVTALEPGIPLVWTPERHPPGMELGEAVRISSSIPFLWPYTRLPAADCCLPPLPPEAVVPDLLTLVDGGCSAMGIEPGRLDVPLVVSNIAFNGYRATPVDGLLDYAAQLLAVYQYRTWGHVIDRATIAIKHKRMRATGWLDRFTAAEVLDIIQDARQETLEALKGANP